ncbi:MAG: hypothetical protein FWC82_01950 [Firmicutes bacterium]|nr:hypothetical protein [Bacillota bacterium]
MRLIIWLLELAAFVVGAALFLSIWRFGAGNLITALIVGIVVWMVLATIVGVIFGRRRR